MRLAAVNACVRVLFEEVRKPAGHIYRRAGEGGKERARAILEETLGARTGVRALDKADEILEKLNGSGKEFIAGIPEQSDIRRMCCGQKAADGAVRRRGKGREATADHRKQGRGSRIGISKTMAETEIALAANEFIIAANRKNGYASVWISPGGGCEICRRMHGRTITNLKPPLHKGCGCTVTAKQEGCFEERESFSGKTFGVDKHGKYAKIGRGDTLEMFYGEFLFDRWAGKPAEVIADGKEIDDVARLTEFYAGKPEEWKKMKRVAYGETEGYEHDIEIHWYENAYVGCVDYKTKI